jgi:hypothetical protein
LQNISEVSICTKGFHSTNFLVGRQKKFSSQRVTYSLQTLQTMSTDTSFLSSVEELNLKWISLPAEFSDFSWCRNISVLELSSNSSFSPNGPSFSSIFYGKQLKLTRFNLAFWSDRQCFPNLERCQLDVGFDLVALPEMPKLTHLSVISCSVLRVLPSFPSLTSLILKGNKYLSKILPSPNVMHVDISQCHRVEDIFGLASVYELKIHTCDALNKIPCMSNIKKLDIYDCPNLSDLQQLTGEWNFDFVQKKRMIRLQDLPALTNFYFCQNIFSLELVDLSGLRNCQGIGNIHHLTIEGGYALYTTEGLGKVTGSCILKYCTFLQSFKDLKNIPTMEIRGCTSVNSITELGNHDSLLFESCPRFEKFLGEYQIENKHNELFSTIHHLFRYDFPYHAKHQIW